jgi:hypothetical protein
MTRLSRFTVIVLYLALSAMSVGQSVRDALYPSEETRAAVCRDYMANPVPFDEEARQFQLEAYTDAWMSPPTVGVEVIAPLAFLARGCNTNVRAGWGRSVEELLEEPRYNSSMLHVLIGRHVFDLAHTVNHLAALTVRDADGTEIATLFPDPWESVILFEEAFSQSSTHAGRQEAASMFAFDLRVPSFRDAVEAGGSVHVRWKAGDAGGMWEWPAEFGDCTGDLLTSCREVR